MDLGQERLKVARALDALEATIGDLVASLAHSNAEATLEVEAVQPPIRRVCEAYAAIDYATHEADESSVVCVGVVGVSADILKKAQLVNERKEEFKKLCAPLHGVMVRVPVKNEPTPTRALSAIRVILRNIQRSDLNLLAAYRKIPLIEIAPVSVTYTRANTRAVYQKTVDELFGLLSTYESEQASADRARLMSLDPKETYLALVKERYPNVRANVNLSRLDARGRGRIQIAAELPVLYLKAKRAPPRVLFFPQQRPRVRPSKLEATPYLATLPVHRYLND